MSEDLREALAEWAEAWEEVDRPDANPNGNDASRLVIASKRLARATLLAAPGGLDVEGVAMALCELDDQDPGEEPPLWKMVSDRRRDQYRETASRFIREYARLLEAQSAPA